MLSSNTSGVSEDANYIESVFSTYLYNGNDTSQTITNGVDLSTKGGMVWVKRRSSAGNNGIVDTARGRAYMLFTNTTDAQVGPSGSTQDVTSFNTDGFSIGTNGSLALNTAGSTYASWTFRKQPKFFDVVTYTGNGVAGRAIPHSLGSVPGCIMVKATSVSGKNWFVYHRALDATAPEDYYLFLDLTNARVLNGNLWETPTSTDIIVNTAGGVNETGVTYVAYIFAHNAGGFGLTGTDNVISCGSFTQGSAVTLGYEPQWLMIKDAGAGGDWYMLDSMRGLTADGTYEGYLSANTSTGEATFGGTALCKVNATGFNAVGFGTGGPYIYIAIRRGPMKVPTDATKVFSPVTYTGNGAGGRSISSTLGNPADLMMGKDRSSSGTTAFYDRLRGPLKYLQGSTTNAEGTLGGGSEGTLGQTTYTVDGSFGILNTSPDTYVTWIARRAPSFFDEVCYTGDGGNQNVTHNLNAIPELIIVKGRSIGQAWCVYNAASGNTKRLFLNNTDPEAVSTSTWNSTSPTSTLFTVGGTSVVNGSGSTYVAYLFATCPGVSKCFNYTGNGSSQTINCGFTAGARWIMIKRTDSTGDWYIWDTARGIVSGNDPHLSLNTTAAEVTTDDTIDTDSTGFIVNQLSATNVNVTSATYIGIAIA